MKMNQLAFRFRAILRQLRHISIVRVKIHRTRKPSLEVALISLATFPPQWTLTYDFDPQIWSRQYQDKPPCQISRSKVILF